MNKIIKYLSYGFLSIIVVILLAFSFSLLGPRISISETETFQGEVTYQMVVINQCGFIRGITEELIGNNCLFIDSGKFYVSKSDFEKAWPESPFDMAEKNYTMYVTLNSKPSLFGGYGPAKIIDITKLDKKPKIRK